MNLVAGLGGAAAGAVVGSYIATLCIRWPAGRQATRGRSRCDYCGRTLALFDLVPIVSSLLLGRRCRSCGNAIEPLHLAVELTAAALAGIALLIAPNGTGAALALFWLLLLAPAILDIRHFWLPDRLTLILAVAGFAAGGVVSEAALADRLVGGATGYASLGIVAIVYRRVRGRDGLGGGDPKLLGAIGLWTGWAALPAVLLLAALAGLAAALALRLGRTARLPFGTCLAAAAILWSAANVLARG